MPGFRQGAKKPKPEETEVGEWDVLSKAFCSRVRESYLTGKDLFFDRVGEALVGELRDAGKRRHRIRGKLAAFASDWESPVPKRSGASAVVGLSLTASVRFKNVAEEGSRLLMWYEPALARTERG